MPALTRDNLRQPLRKLLEQAAGRPLIAWTDFATHITTHQMSRDGIVFMQDEVHPYLYGVSEGLVKLSYVGDDGREWIKSFIAADGFFASLAALTADGRTSFMAVALESTVVQRVEIGHVETLARQHLSWSQALRHLLLLFAARKEERERELLTHSPEERYRAFVEHHSHLLARITQKDLARHLGVTAVGLNRIVMRVRRAAGVGPKRQVKSKA